MRQTVLHNSKQKQMQRHSPVYNWFSRATSCCHSLSNKPLAGALLLVNHRVSDGSTTLPPTGMASCWNTDITHGISLLDRLLFCFKMFADIFLKVFWVDEASQTSRGELFLHSCRSKACPLSMDNRYSQALWSPMFMSEIMGVFVGLQG